VVSVTDLYGRNYALLKFVISSNNGPLAVNA
jgi:hypothetical protein